MFCFCTPLHAFGSLFLALRALFDSHGAFLYPLGAHVGPPESSWSGLRTLLDPLGELLGLPFGSHDDDDDDDDDDDNPPGSMPRFSSILDRSLFPLGSVLTSFLSPCFLICWVRLLIYV